MTSTEDRRPRTSDWGLSLHRPVSGLWDIDGNAIERGVEGPADLAEAA